jgi:hypothetical protein
LVFRSVGCQPSGSVPHLPPGWLPHASHAHGVQPLQPLHGLPPATAARLRPAAVSVSPAGVSVSRPAARSPPLPPARLPRIPAQRTPPVPSTAVVQIVCGL